MERDAKIIRRNKPFVFVNSKTGQGVREATNYIIKDLLFNAPPKSKVKV
jgi:urease accessory protein